MTDETKKPEADDVDIESFFSDPKNTKQVNFLRKSTKKIFAEMASEEEENKRKDEEAKRSSDPMSNFLNALFGGKEAEEKN